MLDYDSKFEGMVKNLENEEWIGEIEDGDKYLYDEEIEDG